MTNTTYIHYVLPAPGDPETVFHECDARSTMSKGRWHVRYYERLGDWPKTRDHFGFAISTDPQGLTPTFALDYNDAMALMMTLRASLSHSDDRAPVGPTADSCDAFDPGEFGIECVYHDEP